ncbi:MAG: ribose 5-phosphate isomerase B [Chloroflexota bacterium]|nr:ribose 5-phosphate isomerase B [Chloroflexota bacterium]
MNIAIGSDHAGFNLKQAIISLLSELGHSYEDFGCYNTSSVDYPDIGRPVAEAVAQGKFKHGILICATGIGMSIVANKVKGIRAAVCHDAYSARRAREHNDANVLCLGEAIIGRSLARESVATYLCSEFVGGRHACRLEKIQALEDDRSMGSSVSG